MKRKSLKKQSKKKFKIFKVNILPKGHVGRYYSNRLFPNNGPIISFIKRVRLWLEKDRYGVRIALATRNPKQLALITNFSINNGVEVVHLDSEWFT